jgi:hypothetical protein
MSYKNKLFTSVNVTREARSAAAEEPNDLAELMANPEYLRYSSAIINEALKEGFDVLQLPNGDIVTTGTKIITNTYVWDATKGTMSKARTPAKAPRARKSKTPAMDGADDTDDAE